MLGFGKKERERKNVALFVDGPNMIRKEFGMDLDVLRKRVEKYGRIVIGKVFLNQFAPEKLIEAVANQGFDPVIALGEKDDKSDVDVAVAVAAMEALHNKNVDVIALATRDADFLALLQKVKEHGKLTVLIAYETALGTSLRNAADHVEIL